MLLYLFFHDRSIGTLTLEFQFAALRILLVVMPALDAAKADAPRIE